MFGSTILDIATGIVFIYLLLSLMCSALNEMVAWFLGLRASTLKSGIEQLLADPALANISQRVYAHPLVKALSEAGKDPSYIPSRTFAYALIDELIAESKKFAAPGGAAGAGAGVPGSGSGGPAARAGNSSSHADGHGKGVLG